MTAVQTQSVPSFVREFLEKVIGERVSRLGFANTFNGTVIEATIENKRIKYAVLLDSGKTITCFADEVAHLGTIQPLSA